MTKLTIITIVLCSYLCKAQLLFDDLKKSCPEELFQKSNTTTNAKYLSEKEKELVILCNLARIDGKWFSENVLEHWVRENFSQDKKFQNAVNTLKTELAKTKNKTPFQPDEKLTTIARNHATSMGKSGKIGHDNFDKRYSALGMKPKGENCQYGLNDTVDIVVELLVDHMTTGYGHRVNILGTDQTSAKFRFIGVAMAKHKKYEINTVMSFSGN
ncbi:MAG: CAP domain-containing protein [Cytophagales bacterium]